MVFDLNERTIYLIEVARTGDAEGSASPYSALAVQSIRSMMVPKKTLTQGGAPFPLVPLVWESNPKLGSNPMTKTEFS